MRRMIAGQGVLIAITLSGLLFAADAVTTVPEAVERYARDMDVAMRSSGPIALEPVFEEGLAAAKGLDRDLERFDEPTYRKVQGMMAGFLVDREEAIVVGPHADFFLKLAREKGTSVDRAFFEAQKETYPDGPWWPAYMEPRTDFQGCVIFDGRTLTALYGVWVAFQKSYPERYRAAAQQELAQIEGEPGLGSTCACGGEEEVQKELENFLKAFPNSPLAAKVAARLQTLKKHASGIRFHCTPG
jgi:hypothetical protein